MEGQVQIIQRADAMPISRNDVDVQIATAHQYPRDINRVLNQVKTFATLDEETAQECFYILPRGGSHIEGVSVRMAEILAGAWGNLRVATEIVKNDGKYITVKAACHDLESNLAIITEVQRKITDRNGKTYSEDMQITTANAASSIAFRNAVLKVIPKALTKKIMDEIKAVSVGKALDMTTSRTNVVKVYASFGVTQEELFEYLNIKVVDDIDADMLNLLRGLANAIKEGTTSVDESIRQELKDRRAAELAKKKAKTAKDMVDNAMNA